MILHHTVNHGYSTVLSENFASFRLIQPGRGWSPDLLPLACCYPATSSTAALFCKGQCSIGVGDEKNRSGRTHSPDPPSRIPCSLFSKPILCTLGLFSQHEELQELHIFLLPYRFGEHHRRISSFWHRSSFDSIDYKELKRPLWAYFKKIPIYPQEDEATDLDNLRPYMSPLHSQRNRIENWSTPFFYEDENWTVVSHIWRGSELFRWFT